jgi:xanthine dehydrogenase accessory factor
LTNARKIVLNFYQALETEIKHQPVVMATVIQVKGSTPREVGAKMLICSDGRIIGTIGGGAGEAKVLAYAAQGEKQRIEIDLSGASDRETQGICGGIMRVWLEPLDDSNLPEVQDILEKLQSGLTVTRTIPEINFTESITPPPTLLMIGAGHVAVPLARVAQMAGFRVLIMDDRTDFATQTRFPGADAISNSLQDLSLPTHNLYVALVTRGFQQDLAALEVLAKRPTKYIGMIGSRTRVKRVLDQVSYSEKIYAPIGLDIGALTPEEIAVSICAELIKVRRGGSGRSLTDL